MGITYDPNQNVISITGYSEAVPCNFDDLYTADKDGNLQLLSPKVVSPSQETLRPNAAGDYQEWETLVDTSHAGATSDQSDATYIQTVGSSSKRDVQHLADPTLGTVDSIEIKIRAYAIGSGSPEKLYIMDKLGASERLTSVSSITRDSWNEYTTGTLTTNPAGDPWTISDITNLQVGVQVQTLGNGETLRVSEIWIIVTASAYQTSLDRPIRPADSGALRLSLIITNYSSSGTVTLTGKDAMGDAQSEQISITGAGTYVTIKSFSSIDTNGVSCTGNYTIEITQPRWGVISKQYDQSFGVDCKITIGDGITESWFAEDSKQIVFSADAPATIIFVDNEGHLVLGKVVDETLKTCEKGCDLVSARLGMPYIDCQGSMELYSSRFLSTSSVAMVRLQIKYQPYGTSNFRMWMCIADKTEITVNPGGTFSIGIHRLTAQKSYIAITPAVQVGTYDDLFIHSCTSAFYLMGTLTFSVKNVVLKNNTYVVYASYFEGIFYLINAEVDNWNFFWSNSTGEVYRQYEFDVHCQDKDGNDLSGVSVVGEYISPYGQAFSQTTDANGDITTQTVDHGFFNQANGNTEQLKTPLKVTYKKAGYQTVVKYYDLDTKTKDVVVMHKAVGVFLDFGRPVINLKKTDPENKNVVVG